MEGQNGMDSKESEEFKDLEQRLKSLKDKAEGGKGGGVSQINREAGVAGLGWRISIELVVGIVVGLAMGYFLDRWLDTKPAFMITLMFLGFGAGIMNVIRLTNTVQRQLNRMDDDEDKK